MPPLDATRLRAIEPRTLALPCQRERRSEAVITQISSLLLENRSGACLGRKDRYTTEPRYFFGP